MSIEDSKDKWTGSELLDHVDMHMEGCSDPNCGVCRDWEEVLDELAKRLGVEGFVPSVRQRRERGW